MVAVLVVYECTRSGRESPFHHHRLTATVKVKLGPVTMTFAGEGSFASIDHEHHTAVIDASGKEMKGAGTAGAKITAVLIQEGPNSTRADIVTDLTVTGKAAQFGRGVMADVSKRLIDQFATNLEQVIAVRHPAPGDQSTAPVRGASASTDSSELTGVPSERDLTPRLDNEALDLGSAAMIPVLKRAVPVIAGLALLGVVLWVIARR